MKLWKDSSASQVVDLSPKKQRQAKLFELKKVCDLCRVASVRLVDGVHFRKLVPSRGKLRPVLAGRLSHVTLSDCTVTTMHWGPKAGCQA